MRIHWHTSTCTPVSRTYAYRYIRTCIRGACSWAGIIKVGWAGLSTVHDAHRTNNRWIRTYPSDDNINTLIFIVVELTTSQALRMRGSFDIGSSSCNCVCPFWNLQSWDIVLGTQSQAQYRLQPVHGYRRDVLQTRYVRKNWDTARHIMLNVRSRYYTHSGNSPRHSANNRVLVTCWWTAKFGFWRQSFVLLRWHGPGLHGNLSSNSDMATMNFIYRSVFVFYSILGVRDFFSYITLSPTSQKTTRTWIAAVAITFMFLPSMTVNVLDSYCRKYCKLRRW